VKNPEDLGGWISQVRRCCCCFCPCCCGGCSCGCGGGCCSCICQCGLYACMFAAVLALVISGGKAVVSAAICCQADTSSPHSWLLPPPNAACQLCFVIPRRLNLLHCLCTPFSGAWRVCLLASPHPCLFVCDLFASLSQVHGECAYWHHLTPCLFVTCLHPSPRCMASVLTGITSPLFVCLFVTCLRPSPRCMASVLTGITSPHACL
jgi:hypothetical protein